MNMRVAFFAALAALPPALGLASIACGPPTPSEGEGEGDGGEGEDLVQANECLAACTFDEECSGGDLCDEDEGVCGIPTCTTDFGCTVQNSGWQFRACDADTPCAPGVCIDLDQDGAGTAGGCALRPTDGGGTECAFGAELTVKDIEGNDVTVCGNDAVCNDANGLCENTAAPVAECANDDECADRGAGFSRCVDGHCGCASSDDCTADLTTCYDGFCGCSDDAECNFSASRDRCNTDVGICECSGDDKCSDGQKCAAPPRNADDD